MSVELITGYAGRPHIDSDDVGHFNAGLLGSGSYVLATGDQMAASMSSANSLTVAAGDAVHHGRHIRVALPETVTIESGTAGQKRNDVVVLRYIKDSATGVESAEVAVVKGTPGATAADPVVNDDDILDGAGTSEMALYRVPLDGITVGAPVKLFEELSPLASVWDSISPTILLDNPSPAMGKDYTLSDSVARYSRIRIYYVDNDGYCGNVDVHDPNGKSASLTTMVCISSSGFWLKSRIVAISGASIITKKSSSWSFTGQINVASPSVSHTDCIAIYRVEGWV